MHSVFIDEEALLLFTICENISDQFTNFDRKKLHDINLSRWFSAFKIAAKPWTKHFFKTVNDFKAAAKTTPSFKLTQVITCHSRLNSFLYKIKKIDSPLCVCGKDETMDHVIFDCPLYIRSRFSLQVNLTFYSVSFPFDLNLVWHMKDVCRLFINFINKIGRLDF